LEHPQHVAIITRKIILGYFIIFSLVFDYTFTGYQIN